MKTAAIVGSDGGVSFAAEGFQEALTRIGENTGNALFQRAVWNLLPGPKFSAGPGLMSPNTVRQIADVLVIPAANQINPDFKMDVWADYVEAVDLPCLVVGLGAQSNDPNLAPEQLALPDGVKRFANAISSRSKTIGVRGDFTKKVLASMGITNTEITGCPSQTLNKRVSGAQIAERIHAFPSKQNPTVALLAGTLQDYTRRTENILYSTVSPIENHTVIYQTDKNILRFIHDRALNDNAREFFSFMRNVVRPDLNSDGFFHYLGKRGRFFSDARSWIDAMSTVDLAIGMRIHGAMAAIQAGRLGVCVAFDSRTLELAKTMGVPYILAENIEDGATIESLIEFINFDPKDFDNKRSKNIASIDSIIQIAMQ